MPQFVILPYNAVLSRSWAPFAILKTEGEIIINNDFELKADFKLSHGPKNWNWIKSWDKQKIPSHSNQVPKH